ncbi:MAG: GTP pyrophosphokinase [Bacteroidetes bacterium GWF2_49_14]|nr:MAG: GTP pyrophosphokinase [Bacteroidetes bacterium GWF2_49_14]
MFDLTQEENSKIKEACSNLLSGLPKNLSRVDKDLINKAFEFAVKAHGGEKRKSGEPYVLHPIAVAEIVSREIGLGTRSIVCALLHDVVEDTEYTLDDIEREFGPKVRLIIDGLTKITGVFDTNSSLQASTFRKLLLTLADDIRVILIKLADRLHNMRTLQALPRKKQIKIASETIYIYAPLAHRLGLYIIKTELEDLSLKYKNPEVYMDLANKINHSEKISSHFINKFIEPVRLKLEEEKFRFEIYGRPKTIYSVWHKMQEKSVPFEQVYDILAVRIIFKPKPRIPEITQCWHIYSILTQLYKAKTDRLRDWVSRPKANGYEALHATFMGPHGKWIEVQIRSERMQDIAEHGFAAHWKYKSGDSRESEIDRWLKKVSDMLQSLESGDFEFLEDFKLNLFDAEMVVFTPKGKEVIMPSGSSALDFAYEIHTEVGKKAIGAKINHKLVPLSTLLKTGDQIEILTSDIQNPQLEQLEYVKTAKAKSSIKDSFKEQRRLEIQLGQKRIEEQLKQLNYRLQTSVFRKLFDEFSVNSKEDLYQIMGREEIPLDFIKKTLKKRSRSKTMRFWDLQFFSSKKNEQQYGSDNSSSLIIQDNPEGTEFRLAKCCEPIPGEEVIGYRNDETSEIIIHKTTCHIANKLISSQGDHIVPAKWTTHKRVAYLARLTMSGIDRIGLVNDITNIISKELSVNIRSMNIESRDGIFEGLFDLYVHHTEDINNLVLNLSKVKGVDSVKRVEKIEDN